MAPDLGQRILKTRDLWEHWEADGRAAKWFAEQHPEAIRGGISDRGGVILISDVLSLAALRNLVDDIENEFKRWWDGRRESGLDV